MLSECIAEGHGGQVYPFPFTPRRDGEGLALFRAVFTEKNVVGVDVMELRPLPDAPTSEFAAAKLRYRLMGDCLLQPRRSVRR